MKPKLFFAIGVIMLVLLLGFLILAACNPSWTCPANVMRTILTIYISLMSLCFLIGIVLLIVKIFKKISEKKKQAN